MTQWKKYFIMCIPMEHSQHDRQMRNWFKHNEWTEWNEEPVDGMRKVKWDLFPNCAFYPPHLYIRTLRTLSFTQIFLFISMKHELRALWAVVCMRKQAQIDSMLAIICKENHSSKLITFCVLCTLMKAKVVVIKFVEIGF